MHPITSARCVWEVVAGILPGEAEPSHTRRWGLTSEEWNGGLGLELFVTREAEAGAYARYLQLLCSTGQEVNWTRVDFIWY